MPTAGWREELGATYQLGNQSFGEGFFLLVGVLEIAMAGLILWPTTRVPAGLSMAGFFVGALSRKWKGATWLFSTAENCDLFETEPSKCAPAFGGHCAVAQLMGGDVKGSAKRWRIEDDRLYLNKNLMASKMFALFARRIRKLAERS